MNFFSLLKHVIKHPLNQNNKSSALIRFAKWQMNNLLNPQPTIHSFTSKSKLIIAKGMAGATQNLYCGLQDYEDMFFLLHFLRREDLFVDIGANIGSYTVLAGAHVGAKVIAFEPFPYAYQLLRDNISINHMENHVTVLNVALGAKKGTIDFTALADTPRNHVATPGEDNTIQVEVEVLDHVLKSDFPFLLKIDVEGFETEVLSGAINTLSNANLKAIIIELNGSGSRYGYDEDKIHNNLLAFGLEPYIYHPKMRNLEPTARTGHSNTIYVRDKTFVLERLQSAAKIQIFDKFI